MVLDEGKSKWFWMKESQTKPNPTPTSAGLNTGGVV